MSKARSKAKKFAEDGLAVLFGNGIVEKQDDEFLVIIIIGHHGWSSTHHTGIKTMAEMNRFVYKNLRSHLVDCAKALYGDTATIHDGGKFSPYIIVDAGRKNRILDHAIARSTKTLVDKMNHVIEWFNKHYDDMELLNLNPCGTCMGVGSIDIEGFDVPVSCPKCFFNGCMDVYSLDGVEGNMIELYRHFSPKNWKEI